MIINKSALILCATTDKKLDESKRRLAEYKNKKYLEMIMDSVVDYDDIVISSALDMRFRYDNFYNVKLNKEIINMIRIYDGIKKCKNEKVLVISCNTPLVGRKLLNDLGSIDFEEKVLIPYAKGKLQKYCAIYDKSILPYLRRLILEKDKEFIDLYNNVKVRYMFPENEDVFTNIELLEHF